jgi:cytochrome c553
MKPWKMTLTAAAAAAMLMTGCGDKKSENAHPTAEAPKAQAHQTQPQPAPAKPAHEVATKSAPTQQAPKPEVKAPTADVPPVPAKEAVEEKIEAAKQSIAAQAKTIETETQKAAEQTQQKIDVATLYAKCAGCHGLNGEKHALGQSNVIAGQNVEDLVKTVSAGKAGYADAFGGDPVIARKHEHRRILELRGRGALNASDLQSQRFQTSQRAGRLGLAVNPMLEFGGPFVAERWDVPNGHSVNRCGS